MDPYTPERGADPAARGIPLGRRPEIEQSQRVPVEVQESGCGGHSTRVFGQVHWGRVFSYPPVPQQELGLGIRRVVHVPLAGN